MATPQELKRARRQQRDVVKKGKKLIETLQPQLKALPVGSWVAVDIETGIYGVGDNEGSACEALSVKCPQCKASFLHWVGSEAHV